MAIEVGALLCTASTVVLQYVLDHPYLLDVEPKPMQVLQVRTGIRLYLYSTSMLVVHDTLGVPVRACIVYCCTDTLGITVGGLL